MDSKGSVLFSRLFCRQSVQRLTMQPVSFDQNQTHQFYAPPPPQQQQQQQGQQQQQQDDKLGLEHGHGRHNPSSAMPSGTLGFYPNASMQSGPSNYMTNQYFPQGYSLNPAAHSHSHSQSQPPQAQQQTHRTYHPSPLSFNPDPSSYPDLPSGDATLHAGSNSNSNNQHAQSQSQPFDMTSHLYADFSNLSIPPPRQGQPFPPNQQLYDWGHLNHNGNQTSPDTPCTDALTQYLSNPALYGSLTAPPLPQQSLQGTISPSQLGQNAINKQFSSLFMERGSSSSASSTEGGHDWSSNGHALDDSQFAAVAAARLTGGSLGDVHAFTPISLNGTPTAIGDGTDITQALRAYLSAPNRLAYGERKLVISTPKVGQKSYGNEKRFLCPHPQATLYGSAWWTTQGEGCPATPIVPPRVNISLSGEEAVKDANATWLNTEGRSLDEKLTTDALLKRDEPFVGNVAGRNLHVSDNEGKRSNFTAQVRIRTPSARSDMAPQPWGGADLEPREIIGTFESKEIKIISKPSKKKTNTKSSERESFRSVGSPSPLANLANYAVVITHGSTIALYNRTKSQTASTRYLNIDTDLTTVRGSDGQHVTGARQPVLNADHRAFPGLAASAGVWESFIIWLADPTKPAVSSGLASNHPGGPSPPMNALAPGPIPSPIRYNSLVVLQSLQTGRCTPVMTIRRIDQDAEAVGQDGNVMDHSTGFAPEGEMPGDMVAQVQKVAFELYDPILASQLLLNRSAGDSRWLACDHESVIARYVRSERKWSPIPIPYRGGKSHSTPTTPNRGFHILPMTPHTSSTNLPSTPSSPVSSGSSIDYFGPHSRKASSTHLISPISSNGEPLPGSTDGGPLRRHRTGSTGRAGPLGRPAHKKRQSQDSHSHSASASSSYDHLPNALGGMGMLDHHRQSWALNIGDVAVWYVYLFTGVLPVPFANLLVQDDRRCRASLVYVLRTARRLSLRQPHCAVPRGYQVLAPGCRQKRPKDRSGLYPNDRSSPRSHVRVSLLLFHLNRFRGALD